MGLWSLADETDESTLDLPELNIKPHFASSFIILYEAVNVNVHYFSMQDSTAAHIICSQRLFDRFPKLIYYIDINRI